MELSEFPQEVVEKLTEYLSLSDLLSCSLVNKGWKRVFDINRAWRRFCTYHPSYFYRQLNKLKHTKHLVFDFCEARQLYYKEQYVKNNIFYGDYNVAEVGIGAVYCDCAVDHVDEVGNHWLFISCMKNLDFISDHMITVWNLNSNPVLHTSVETPLGLTTRKLDTKMKVNKTKLFYILDNAVLVYQFSHPEFELKYLYKIEQLKYPLTVTAMLWSNSLIFSFLYSSYHCKFLIAPYVCVWDEEGLLLFKNYDSSVFLENLEECQSNNHSPVLDVKGGNSAILVANSLNQQSLKTTQFHVFNIHTFKYVYFFSSKTPSHCNISTLLSGRVAIVADVAPESRDLSLINFNTDSHSLNRSQIGRFLNDLPKTVTDFKILSGNEGKDIILLINQCWVVSTDLQIKEIKQFKLKSGNTSEVEILNPNILVNQYSEKNKVNTEVWNYKNGQKLYMLDLCPALGFQQCFFRFCFIENYTSPPKIIVFQEPTTNYAYHGKKSKVVVISFW